jgi:hypothetical protein
MSSLDRRDISGLLLKYFPTLENATSDEWHGFLDKFTGLETPLDMPNANAFDRWRMALQDKGFPVFRITPERIAQIKAAAEKLLEAEEKRAAALGATLTELAKAAPSWPSAELMAEHERARSK